MKKRIVLCLILAVALTITGCTMFRKPDPGNQPLPNPGNQPGAPEQQQPTNPELPPQTDNRTNRDNMLEQPLASDISDRAMEIAGVSNAVAIVLGNMAMIGVELQDGVNANQTEEQVEDRITTNFADIETVYVTSEVDLVDNIAAVSERISRGQPTSELMDELFQIWQRIQD